MGSHFRVPRVAKLRLTLWEDRRFPGRPSSRAHHPPSMENRWVPRHFLDLQVVLRPWVLHPWVLHPWVLHPWVLHPWALHPWVLLGALLVVLLRQVDFNLPLLCNLLLPHNPLPTRWKV